MDGKTARSFGIFIGSEFRDFRIFPLLLSLAKVGKQSMLYSENTQTAQSENMKFERRLPEMYEDDNEMLMI